ncbi:MAG: hypothetical protein AB1941_16865 [Gemmatimonadota bacterium]
MADTDVRLEQVLEMAQQALELLDQAVGKGARLRVQDRALVRDHLMAPRNHLRTSYDSLRRNLEREEARAAERRSR